MLYSYLYLLTNSKPKAKLHELWQNGNKVTYTIFTLQRSLWGKEKVNKTEVLDRSKLYSLGIKLSLKSISQVSTWHEAGASTWAAPCCRADGWCLLSPLHIHTGDSSRSFFLCDPNSAQIAQRKKDARFGRRGKKKRKKKRYFNNDMELGSAGTQILQHQI